VERKTWSAWAAHRQRGVAHARQLLTPPALACRLREASQWSSARQADRGGGAAAGVAAKGGRDADAAAVRAVHAARGAAAGRRGPRDRRAGRRQRPPAGLRGTAVRGNCVTSLPCLARSAHTAFEAADAGTGCMLTPHGFLAGGVCYAGHAWFVCGSSITERPALTSTGGQPFSQCPGVRCAQTAAGSSIRFFSSAV